MKKRLVVLFCTLLCLVVMAAFIPVLQDAKTVTVEDTSADEVALVVSQPKVESQGAFAEAKLWPKQDASLGFAGSGVVDSLYVSAGNKVSKGDVLAELKGIEKYRLEYSQATVTLLEAQDELKTLNDSQPKDKAEAERALIEAKKTLDEKNEDYIEFDTPAYRTKLDTANKAYKDKWSEVEDAQDLVDDVAELAPDSDRRRTIEDDYKKVRQDYDKLERDYAALKNDKDQAWADVLEAQAAVDNLQRDVDELADGPKKSKLDVVNQKIAAAEDEQASAEKSIELLQIIAPFDGEVVSVDLVEGELAAAGSPLIVLLDASEKILKTVDLSETDMAGIQVGNRVKVTFDAYPDSEIGGTVTKITNWADKYLGDVVFPVEITLDNTSLPLLWGMTASVYF